MTYPRYLSGLQESFDKLAKERFAMVAGGKHRVNEQFVAQV
jgi:hypothetical protein